MKPKRILHNFVLAFATFLLSFAPVFSAYAASNPTNINYNTLKFYAENNIVYYNPNVRANCSSSLDCNIAGDTFDERLWSGLRNLGFTPEQSAALMANIKSEGGSPARQESAYNTARNQNCLTSNGTPYSIWDDSTNGQKHAACMQAIYSKYYAGRDVTGIGLGFVQWSSHARRLGYLQLMQDAGLIKYFDGDAYKTYGGLTDDALKQRIIDETGSDADYWALWCTALKYIYQELTEPSAGSNFTNFFSYSSVEDIASYVARVYEACGSCQVGGESHEARVALAKEIYGRYQNGEFASVEGGSAIGLGFSNSALSDGSQVTIIGDSITVASKTQILKLLPQADVIAQDSKQFAGNSSDNPSGQQIVESLNASGNLRTTVVIALGTNNAGLTTPQVDAMVAAIGDKHNIIFVNNYDDADPSKYNSNNSQFISAATKYDNVSIADWKKAVTSAEASNPGASYILHEDAYSVHPTAAGQELFAKTISNAISGRSSSLNTCSTAVGAISDPSQALPYLNGFINYINGITHLNIPLQTSVTANAIVYSIGHSYGGCTGAADCGQCTAVSGWFVSQHTGLDYGNGNGIDVVGNLLSSNPGNQVEILDARSGAFPSGLAIFSTTSSTDAGHTGLVLGRDASGNIITLENNVDGNGGISVRVRTQDDFSGRAYSRFYPLNDVNLNGLN